MLHYLVMVEGVRAMAVESTDTEKRRGRQDIGACDIMNDLVRPLYLLPSMCTLRSISG